MADNKVLENMPKIPRHGGGGGGGKTRFMPHAKPKNAKQTLLRIARLYLRWKVRMFTAILLTILSVVVSLFVPYLMGQAVNAMDIHTQSINQTVLLVALAALVGCYLCTWLITTANGWIMTTISQELVLHIREEFFAKLQKLPLSFYDTRSNGDTMSRLTNDVDTISSTVSQTTTQLISGVLSIVGSFIMMLLLSPALTLVSLATIPLVVLLTKQIASRSKKFFTQQAILLGRLNGMIEENITEIKMVKAFNRQERILQDFRVVNTQLRKNAAKANMWSGFMMPFMNVINNLSFALIATAGGVLSVWGIIDVGIVVSFISYAKQFGQPLNNIAGMFTTIQSALAGAERVFEIMDEQEEQADAQDAVALHDIKGNVAFENVSFGYGNKAVLKNVSFHVEPGEVVALVGQTGAGKTTIVNLLTRFYESNSGEILIDGINIQNIRRDNLRSYFSVVLQDTCLFSGSILDNILYSSPKSTSEQAIAAAKLAFADDFIMHLPNGYQTQISAGNDHLSQGQRQLIAIARAILCDAKILILDEATSSVDTKTEKSIQKALLSLMKNKTSFLIAHRLSTIRDADKIMVIEDGEILESGIHSELMAQKGGYYAMVLSQTGIQ